MQDAICTMVEDWRAGKNSFFIHEFATSILVLNEVQFYRGHCMLLLKNHVREIYDLPAPDYEILAQELYWASKGLANKYQPQKMNIQCLGNQQPHIHWHIIPRYQSDPNASQQPFSEAIRNEVNLDDYKISPRDAEIIAAELRNQWSK